MNSLLASNINGGFNNQQVSNGSSSVLLSSIDFTVTDRMTNYSSSQQGTSLIKLTDTEDILCNGQNKAKTYDQNKNKINNYVAVNGNKEKSEDSIPVPKVQLFTGKISAEWIQSYKIGAGLHNIGNTCFMNTVIQCLTYCPPLANYLLLDKEHASKCSKTLNFCMICLLQRHIRRTIGKTGEVVRPTEIYHRLKSIAKHFQFGRQEDAHEFLRYVIDHLWKACLTQVNGVKLDSASKETTIINKIFGGYHRSQVVCLGCKNKSNTFDHFMDFILDIRQGVNTLEKALEKFIQPELLQQENSYKCPKCKIKVQAQKRFTVFQAPLVATFQLKRFDYNRSFGGKITKLITYPEILNLRPYMSDPHGDPVCYRLNAVLVHSGVSCNSGHYYCYVRNSNDFWYIMDDSRVHQVNVAQVLSQSAYVLFYIKTQGSERAPLKKCLDNKNTFMKGTISNSPFTKVAEVNNVMKPIPLSDSNSPFSNCKPHNPPNGVKKNNSPPLNGEKICFGFKTTSSSTQLSLPKNKSTSSESVTVKQNVLVPYMEDSSESSDASDSYPSQNKSNSIISSTNTKHISKEGSSDHYKKSPQCEIKRKISKFVPGASYNPVNNTPLKMSATNPWIVTDFPLTPLSSSSSSTVVNSTTDWDVIEASDLALNSSSTVKENKNSINESLGSLKESKDNSIKESLDSFKENKNNIIKESSDSPKKSMIEMSHLEHLDKANESSHDLYSGVKMSNDHETSGENCDFRKQIPKNKAYFPEDKEINIKRKYFDSNTKISKESPHFEHSESRCSPLRKKFKHAQNSSYLNSETESKVRNEDNSSYGSIGQHRHYTFNCDNNSRTCNGILNSDKAATNHSTSFHNSPIENNKNNEKDRLISNGNQDISSSQYSNCYPHEKDKQPIFNKGNNTFLFGTEVPTWREENHYRPSLNSGHEVRRTFDNYDNELDRGKVRKSKMKDHYHHSYQKKHFQKYDTYNGRFNNRRFYNNRHPNFRKGDHRSKWNSNYGNSYQRNSYHNQHHRY